MAENRSLPINIEGKNNIPGFTDVQTTGTGTTFEQKFNYFVFKVLIPNIKYAFVGVSILILLYYISQWVVATGTEEVDTQQKNFLWAAVGFFLMGLSMFVVESFITGPNEELVNIEEIEAVSKQIISYISLMLGAIAILFISIAAVRIIVSQGDEEEITSQKKNFVWGIFGLIIVFLADVSVKSIYNFQVKTGEQVQPGNIEEGSAEIFTMIAWLLQYLSITAVATLMLAGFYYVISMGDEEKTTLAKNIIMAVIVAIVIIFSAYAYVSTIANPATNTIG
jgi:hypothetical protein